MKITQESKEPPDIEEIARKLEEFITDPPAQVLERMKRRREELRRLRNPTNLGDLMDKRY